MYSKYFVVLASEDYLISALVFLPYIEYVVYIRMSSGITVLYADVSYI